MERKNPVSIKDIAKLAGVSTASVSRILNNSGRFSEKTKQKVLDIVDQYGYVSNMTAKSLRISSTLTIGLIIPDIQNAFYSTISSCIEEFFFQRGYSVYICNTNNNPERELIYFRNLESRNVDGIIVVSCMQSVPDNIVTNIPIVLLDRTPVNNYDIPTVMSDDYDAIIRTTNLLISKGCRHLVYLDSNTAKYNKKRRLDGYKDALSQNNMIIETDRLLNVVRTDEDSMIQSELCLTQFINSGKTLDGVVCSNDNAAVGALYAIKRSNYQVPQDVKVIGYDNNILSRLSNPTISTVNRYPELMSETACHLLMKQINDEQISERHVIIQTDIIERETTK